MPYGAEPALAGDAVLSLRDGTIHPAFPPRTIADGLRTALGDKTLFTLRRYLRDILLTDEDEITGAMRLVWERMKIIIEPSSAVPLAAVLRHPEIFSKARVGIILSGGNVDASVFFDALRSKNMK